MQRAMAVAVLAMAACSKGKEPEAQPQPSTILTDLATTEAGEPIQEFLAFADDVCACKDMTCVEKVQKDFADKNKDKKGDIKMTEEEAEAVKNASDKMTKCIEAIVYPAAPQKRVAGPQDRAEIAGTLEDAFRDRGIDLKAMATGPDAQTLSLVWSDCGSTRGQALSAITPFMQKEMTDSLKAAGFTRVECNDWGGDLADFGAAQTPAMAAMEKFALDICACRDLDCVQGVQKEFARKYKDAPGDVKLSESEARAVADASDRMTKCIEAIASK